MCDVCIDLQCRDLVTEIERKIDGCEHRWLRRLLWINYKDRITNREIRERTKMIQLSIRIRRMRMKWTGHILRMSDNKTVKQVFRWEPSSKEGQRSAGWTVWKMIYIEQESQDTASQPADNVHQSRRQEVNGGSWRRHRRLKPALWWQLTWPGFDIVGWATGRASGL